MNKSARCILFSGMAIVFLLGACAPAPAATQDAESNQQQINEMVTQTLSAQSSQAINAIPTVDTTAIVQNIQANNDQFLQTSVAATVTALQPEATEPPTATATVTVTPTACNSITTGENAPTITSISPSGGFNSGGSVVTIRGTNFIKGQGYTHFCFGEYEASIVVCKTTTQCTAVTPLNTGENTTVKVTAYNDAERAASDPSGDSFTYIPFDPNAPLIKSIQPQEGTIRGGTKVTVTGERFIPGKQGVDANVTRFYFGSNEAKDVVCSNALQCTMISPAGEEGFVTVEAKNGDFGSQHIPGNDFDGFKYNGIPTYGCGVFTVTPKNLTVFKPEESFTIKWIVKNTGLRTWPAGLDVKYSAGVDMAGPNIQSIPSALEPNDTYTITLDARAPKNPGKYYMTWIVEGQGCQAYVAIVVE